MRCLFHGFPLFYVSCFKTAFINPFTGNPETFAVKRHLGASSSNPDTAAGRTSVSPSKPPQKNKIKIELKKTFV